LAKSDGMRVPVSGGMRWLCRLTPEKGHWESKWNLSLIGDFIAPLKPAYKKIAPPDGNLTGVGANQFPGASSHG
jgi:hypothetical protein